MFLFIKKILFVLAITFLTVTQNTFAQNGINSPYSRYGFGILSDRATGFNKGMSGVGFGFRDSKNVNTTNPASYSAVDSLTALFDLGLTFQNGNYKMSGLQQNARNTSFDYFAFQFRAFRRVGVTLGILPFSKINYNFNSEAQRVVGTESTTSTYSFTGSGGLHQAFIGAGWEPVRNLSIGTNISFLYGDYMHSTTMVFSDTTSYSTHRSYKADISTYKIDAGLQYTLPINKKDQLTLGLTYSLGHDINNRAIRLTQTLNSNNLTINSTNDTLRNAFQLPHVFGAGLTYAHSNKWRIGVDAELEKWADCRFPTQEGTKYTSSTGQLNDRVRLAAGGMYIPNADGQRYFQRVHYKLGAYYSRPYAKADNNGIEANRPTEFGISAGVTLPIKSRWIWYNAPSINIAFQWNQAKIGRASWRERV